MASAAPWGAVPQAEGALEGAEQFIEEHTHTGSHANTTATATSSSTTASISSKSEDGTFRPDDKEVRKLARTFTQHSVRDASGNHVNPFLGSDDPLLDPNSGKFSARAWAKTLVGITSRDPERYPKRVAGVSFKNLNVHGFGVPTDYQKTFGNYPLELLSLVDRVRGQGKTKIQILRNMDGLVKSGEMLVVLGRPGSGCSTLLKTISGETNGFFVDERSEINYQGMLWLSSADWRGR
jgi:ATP-binding cassette subfamily G (WHITE) protein 2 (PDR)